MGTSSTLWGSARPPHFFLVCIGFWSGIWKYLRLSCQHRRLKIRRFSYREGWFQVLTWFVLCKTISRLWAFLFLGLRHPYKIRIYNHIQKLTLRVHRAFISKLREATGAKILSCWRCSPLGSRRKHGVFFIGNLILYTWQSYILFFCFLHLIFLTVKYLGRFWYVNFHL